MSLRVQLGSSRRSGRSFGRSGPRSTSRSSQLAGKGLIVFGLFFLLPGLAISWFLGVRPLLMSLQARNQWERVPARVTSSEVRTHRGSDSTTYSIEISYVYEWEGREMEGDRYDFMSGSSSGYQSKRRVVQAFPVGHEFELYVNPSAPEESVIDPSFQWLYVGLLGFGSVFVAVGAGAIIGGFRSGKADARALSGGADAALPLPPADRVDERGNVVLKTSVGPWAKVVGVLLIALFWNGVISFLVREVVEGWRGGQRPVFLTLFMIPFLLVGLGLIVGFFYNLLAAFNPRVLVVIGPGSPKPGMPFTLDWMFTGSAARLHNFTLQVIGEELATYRMGTNTYTDKRVFYAATLADLDDPHHIEAGTVEVTLPMDVMCSMKAPNNEIRWVFEVHGHIQFWPNVKVEYPFVVEPQPARFA